MFRIVERKVNKVNNAIKITKAEDDDYTVKIFNYNGDIAVSAKPKKDLLPLSYMPDQVVMELPSEPVLLVKDVDHMIDILSRSKESAIELQKFMEENGYKKD